MVMVLTAPDNLITRLNPVETTAALNRAQMVFMLYHHSAIELAFMTRDDARLREIAASPEFKAVFAGITFEDACDRYERMIAEACRLS